MLSENVFLVLKAQKYCRYGFISGFCQYELYKFIFLVAIKRFVSFYKEEF